MPVSLLTFSSTVTVADAKPKRNKLRRRRHSYATRQGAMAVDVPAAKGAENDVKDESVASSNTTLLDQESDSSAKAIDAAKHIVHDSPSAKDPAYDDAQAQVIESLRSQISDLLTQVTQLNGKLVSSYDRVSDLEDELHVASSNLRSNSIKISQLELDRTQHIAALSTGLLVEKSHVTSELTRLMERATEEAARRGQAETARANIEQDLDDLSANLFDQANRMVAEARLEKAMCERKALDAEMALKSAEEAVGLMQVQMQALSEEKDRTAEEVEKMRALMGKGKYVEHPAASQISVRLLSVHTPYQEFLLFVAHLRTIRPATTHPPTITTFLPLPFLARLATEDSDPTVRLDFAPSLNWLSRRSVLSALYTGQLTIEPMSMTHLLLETTTTTLQAMIPGSHHSVSCALCGAHIFPEKPDSPSLPLPSHPLSSLSFPRPTSGISGSATWSSSIFKNPLSISTSAAPSPPLTPPPNVTTHSAISSTNSTSTTIYVFRLAQTQTPTHPTQQQKPQNYPLCNSGWCLARLRTTCSLWAFIRAGVIDRVWEEEPPTPTRPSLNGKSASTFNNSSTSLSSSTSSLPEKEKAPPLPPRRRSKMSTVGASVGSLWGMASNALKSQPQSPVRQQDKETPKPEVPEKSDNNNKKLSVTVPPPLPRRSMDRSVSQSKLDESPLSEVPEVPLSPTKPRKSEETKDDAAVNLTVPDSKSTSPQPRVSGIQLSQTSSQSSSIPSAADEFTTPVEEFGPSVFTPVQPIPPVTAPLSPTRRAKSRSPPVSPLRPNHARTSSRTSLPPPLSPKSVPLPDSRPGSPFPVRSRPTSKTVDATNAQSLQAQLSEADGKNPSRVASPVPGGAGAAPPPVPRRAAARRVVPPPPGTAPSARPSTPATVPAVNEEKKEELDTSDARTTTEASVTTAATRNSPPPLPRRGDHVAHLSINKINGVTHDSVSVSDYGDADDKTEVEVQVGKDDVKAKPSTDTATAAARDSIDGTPQDDPLGLYVGTATWEERTWKEITRLREDMFWARIGAVRN